VLEAVTRWDAVRGHVLAVLRDTVPSPEPQGELAALGPEVHAPSPPRATAAHPRAFRGTRYRPPKLQQPAAVDVRPYLLVRRHVDRVLELVGQGGVDPVVARHRARAGLDPALVMWPPLLGGCTWAIGAFAALARALELHHEPALRATLVGWSRSRAPGARSAGGVTCSRTPWPAGSWRRSWCTRVASPARRCLSSSPPSSAVRSRSMVMLSRAARAPAGVRAVRLELDAISARRRTAAPGRDDVTALVLSTVERSLRR
jgi:hypothetical protein